MDQLSLGLRLWEGIFEGKQGIWLRWCDQEGNVLLAGDECAGQERQRAEQAEQPPLGVEYLLPEVCSRFKG